MAGEFAVRVWGPRALAPAAGPTFDTEELALDRDLLGVDDGSVSRTANAPKLRATGLTTLRFDVPQSSARAVLVIEGVRFEALQHGIPPSDQTWKIAPGQLSRPGRLARDASASAALVRQLDWERSGATHHLMLLPQALLIAPGEAATIIAPALLVIGEAAVDITPTDTLVPAAPRADVPPSSFRLSELEEALEDPRALDAYASSLPPGPFRLPGSDVDAQDELLEAAAGRLLDHAFRGHCFFPLLDGARRPRLALAYQRTDDTTRVIVSSKRPDAFIRDLLAWLDGDRDRTVNANVARAVTRSASSPPVAREPAGFGAIETLSPPFAAALEHVARVAGSDLSILLLGESGTGKEHLAQEIHRASPRAQAPFIAVNCSAIADNLIESELFGHRKGAFTGAQTDRAGAFVAAEGGTLLLDEIGDAPLRVQLALLRALDAKTIRPVGSDLDRKVDVRLLAATSRDLPELIEQRAFRKDLYYRLAEHTIELPPLRERRADIPALIAKILAGLSETTTVSRQAVADLVQYDWPGNVRELRNALRRAVALNHGRGVLQAVHFAQLGGAATPSASVADDHAPLEFPPHVVQRADDIWREQAFLEETTGNRYDQRALNRAALLCLAARASVKTWPYALTREWNRLFGERWASSEEGRGLRGVMRQLGLDVRDVAGEERLLAAVGRARG